MRSRGGHVAGPADFACARARGIDGIVTGGTTGARSRGGHLPRGAPRGRPNLPVAPLSPEAETRSGRPLTLEQVPPDAMSLYAQKEATSRARDARARFRKKGFSARRDRASPRALRDDASVELTGIGAVWRRDAKGSRSSGVVPGGGARMAASWRATRSLPSDGTPVAGLGYERAIGVIRGPEERRSCCASGATGPRKRRRGLCASACGI